MKRLARMIMAATVAIAGCPAVALAAGSGGATMGSAPQQSPREDPQAAYQAGVVALQAQNYREAIRELRTARRAAPSDGVINYALGLAYSGNGDAEEAQNAFERASNAPNSPAGARLQLGLLHLSAGNREQALAQQSALATMIQACDATCGDARRAQLQAAHDQLSQALATPSAPAADPATTGWNFPTMEDGRRAYAEAVGHINQERFTEAFAALDQAHAAAGPNADVLNYMGFVSRKLGRLDDALAFYNDALRIDPGHLGATEYLGELYIQMGALDRARTQLARLDELCAYGCEQREELARWLADAQ